MKGYKMKLTRFPPDAKLEDFDLYNQPTRRDREWILLLRGLFIGTALGVGMTLAVLVATLPV